MELKDVIFQGVWGRDKAARLTLGDGVKTIETPSDVGAGQVVDVLVALLYPDTDDGRSPDWLKRAGGDVRLGLITEHGGRTYRLLRAAKPGSVRLQTQRKGGYELSAKGVESVTRTLDNDLARPSLGQFLTLNCWAFGRAASQLEMRSTESHEFSRKERRTLEAYRRAKRAESLEDEVQQLKERAAELREKWGEVLERESELKQAKRELDALESDRLGADQLELLRNKDRRIERLERKLDEMEGREESTRRAVEETEPTPPWRDETFWGGLVAAVVAIGLGIWFEESYRWLMMLDAVGFGIALFVVLRYLTLLERQGVHNVRLESTRRRGRELRQELVDLQERIDHILTHADAENEHELIQKNERAEKLESLVREIENELSDYRQNDEYQQDSQQLEQLERDIEMKTVEFEDLQGSTPPVFELENQLHGMDINPKAGLERLEAHRNGSGADGARQTEVVCKACEKLGLFENGRLNGGRLHGMWQKICGHVLGAPFGRVVVEQNEIQLDGGGDQPFDELAPSGSTERRQVNCALAFAAHAATASRTPGVASLWIPHPEDFGSTANLDAWRDVFGQAEGKFGVALLK